MITVTSFWRLHKKAVGLLGAVQETPQGYNIRPNEGVSRVILSNGADITEKQEPWPPHSSIDSRAAGAHKKGSWKVTWRV